MARKAFFLKRLNEHVQYLKKINATLQGEADFQGTTHQECPLGQWIYGSGETEVAAMKDRRAQELFKSLLAPHEQFHLLSQEALQKKQAGDEAGASLALTGMHLFSTILTHKLLELDNMD